MRPRIGVFHLRRRKALGRDQGRAECDLQHHLVLDPLGRLWQGREQPQSVR